ncbi:RMD1 family protein [Tautonia plasticadhaerens]|uniref:DUF155 domain-containing protein n=1 Tax=Tautonia plasticadhaerens TaxID=2527974 RepID=A0A518H1Y0_9BACT|nr:hypothetical protein [Tautonia plasticadhaerens]QDV34852.1 hypothetical protein ElP_27490 [Tautonia plasticadhaerens]
MLPDTPIDATIHLAFAFDLGYEIDLERARPLLAAGEAGGLARRRRTPESIRYRPAPLRLGLDASGVALPPPGRPVEPPRADLSLFDFGAISLAIRFPVRMTPGELLALAGELADPTPLTASARLVLAPWLDRIRPVVSGYEVSDMSEEYVIFQLGEATPGWLDARREWVAGLVRLETERMSPEEVTEATRLGMSYAPNDAIVIDWAAAVVADRDCADTLQVLEFANVQLLEFRHIDDRLDDRLERAYGTIHPASPRLRLPMVWSPTHNDAVRQVRELEIEATSLFERADNALKLIGDQYLVRVYDLASARFHLREWQNSIRRKVETVGNVYDLLVSQAGNRRAEFLELVIILLIALEIVLAFFR